MENTQTLEHKKFLTNEIQKITKAIHEVKAVYRKQYKKDEELDDFLLQKENYQKLINHYYFVKSLQDFNNTNCVMERSKNAALKKKDEEYLQYLKDLKNEETVHYQMMQTIDSILEESEKEKNIIQFIEA